MRVWIVLMLFCVLLPGNLHAGKAPWYFTWKDTNVPRCDHFQIYRDGALIATVADTPFVDSTATWGARHTYWLYNVRAGLMSGRSNEVSCLGLDWTQGATDTMRLWQRADSALLIVALPYSRWTINWAYQIGSPERVVGHCDYDFDFNNGRLNLSDFCYFAMYWRFLALAQRANAIRGFGNCYGLQERMEYSK